MRRNIHLGPLDFEKIFILDVFNFQAGWFLFRCKITQTEILFCTPIGPASFQRGSWDNMINWPVRSISAHQVCARIDISYSGAWCSDYKLVLSSWTFHNFTHRGTVRVSSGLLCFWNLAEEMYFWFPSLVKKCDTEGNWYRNRYNLLHERKETQLLR